MLSIANVKSGAQPESYYSGGDDYYNSKKEKAPSQWRGELARELELEGAVRPEDVDPLLNGILPGRTTDSSRRWKTSARRRSHIECTEISIDPGIGDR